MRARQREAFGRSAHARGVRTVPGVRFHSPPHEHPARYTAQASTQTQRMPNLGDVRGCLQDTQTSNGKSLTCGWKRRTTKASLSTISCVPRSLAQVTCLVHHATRRLLNGNRMRVQCALQLHLSWIPGDYPGYEQWYYKCKPTCVFRVSPLPCHVTHPTSPPACTDRPAAC